MAQKSNKRKITSWMTSSFDDFAVPELPVDKKNRGSKGVGFSSRARNPQKVCSELWVDIYAPTTKDDLAVHKKKIQEVECWLVESMAGMKGRRFLLLTGPSGCCKSTTIKILAKEAQLNVVEWINPLSRYDSSFLDEESPWIPGDKVAPISQTNLFKDFFVRTSKYQSVCDNSKIGNLVLVKDFPNVILRDPSAFHTLLRHYNRKEGNPVVFVVTDSTNRQSNVKHLFPQDIQQDLSIVNIQFNSIANGILLKALSRILNMKNICEGSNGQPPPSKDALEALAEASGGDIRSAINALQFAVTKDVYQLKDIFASSARSKGSSKSKSRSKTKDKSAAISDDGTESLAVVGGKDASLFLFRALGKVLYCKRDQEGKIDNLPTHLKSQERLPLLEKAEDIYDRAAMGATSLGTFLHQNMMPFYPDIESVSRALHHLSDSDVLSAEWLGRNVLDEYAASVAIRGLMHENKKSSVGGAWRAFNKPQWFGAHKQSMLNISALKNEHRMTTITTEELTTVVVPYQAKIFEMQRKGTFSKTKELGLFMKHLRIQGEKLDENDAIDTSLDDYEPSCGTKSSNPNAAEETPLENENSEDPEEDFLIEEYPDD